MNLNDFINTPIPVIEIFQSISGEGISAGNIVTFVRSAGCNLRCTWCDTKYSFIESGNGVEQLLPNEIVDRLISFGSNEIICTGGEPLEEGKVKRYLPLFLTYKDFDVHIETSGGSILYSEQELIDFNVERDDFSYCMDIKCPSSHMEKHNIFDNVLMLQEDDELKFVVQDMNDIKYAMEVIDAYKYHLAVENIALNFSPVFNTIKPVEIVDFLKSNTKFFEDNELWPRLSLQLHKMVWPQHQRGV